MAILDFSKDSEKSISLHFHTQELGPEGQPLYYHTPEVPAVIKGHVEFRAVKETKGSDIELTFEARAESKWTESYGKNTVSFHQVAKLQEKTWEVKLNRTSPKVIAPGVTRYDFEVELQEGLPPSIEGTRAWFHYRFKAHIKRDFPRRDMAVKQLVWVYSSSLKANEPLEPKIYQDVWNETLPYSCTIPSDVLYQGQTVPLTVQFDQLLDSGSLQGQDLIVVSAVVKLKQYTTLLEKKLTSTKRKEKKTVVTLPVTEGWPATLQGSTKTILVELPGARQLAGSIDSEALIKRHCLKLIMMVRTTTSSDKDAKELRMEMDVKITAPRPEHIKNISALHAAPPAYQTIDSDDEDSRPPAFNPAWSSSSGEGSAYPKDDKQLPEL